MSVTQRETKAESKRKRMIDHAVGVLHEMLGGHPYYLLSVAGVLNEYVGKRIEHKAATLEHHDPCVQQALWVVSEALSESTVKEEEKRYILLAVSQMLIEEQLNQLGQRL